MYGTGFGIAATIDQSGDAGVDDRTGTHRAGFQRDRQRAVEQSPVAEKLGGGADGDDLGMGCGIMVDDPAVVAGADDSAGGVVENHAADGHFVHRAGQPGLFDSQLHEVGGGHG